MSTWPHFTLDDYAQLAEARDRCAGASDDRPDGAMCCAGQDGCTCPPGHHCNCYNCNCTWR